MKNAEFVKTGIDVCPEEAIIKKSILKLKLMKINVMTVENV